MTEPKPKTRKHVAVSSQRTHAGGPAPSMPPPNAAKLIREAAATGAKLHEMRFVLRCSPDVFERWLREFPELREALGEGREIERKTLHSTLYKTATEGKGRDAILAAMFLLKARHGYREGEEPQQGNRVNITFALPGAKPLESVEVIDCASTPVQRLPNSAA